jgi:RNA polymerase sigma-70 factor (ECF subfamily)
MEGEMVQSHGEVTQLLSRWGEGDRGALDSLAPIVHSELRQIAEGYLRRERSGHTLQPTALVNEAWLRLVRQDQPSFENRRRFFALAAQVMRHILVDYARTHKRTIPQDAPSAATTDFEQFLALDQALAQLAQASPRQARIIEMRYFGGLNGEEIAELLDVSAATVSRDQAAAEAWLARVVSA